MKYVLVANKIISPNDGQLHTISSHRLAELYELNPKDCIFIDSTVHPDFIGIDEDQIWLEPRDVGDYKEFLEMQMECYERDRKAQEDSCLNCGIKGCKFYHTIRDDICIAYTRMN